ncbi:MAG TPA: AIR synthase-related protein, partial [Pseudolabrys sp.]
EMAVRHHLISRYLLPQPRNALAEAVRTHASAAMDVSDGLVGDLAKLCRVSKVAADIEVARIPYSDAAQVVMAQDAGARETALTGGDDYEILCTVPPDRAESFRAAAKAANVPVTEIGEIGSGEGARFRNVEGHVLSFGRASFSHF